MNEIPFEKANTEDVLVEGVLAQYERGWTTFFFLVGRLSDNIYLVQRLVEFPFELFGVGVPGWSAFFISFVANALEANTLIITRLATDQGADLYTLPRFKNQVRAWVRPQYQSGFDARLKTLRFDRATTELFEKTRKLRDTVVAHLHEGHLEPRTHLGDVKVLLAEQGAMCSRLKTLLSGLRFNSEAHYGLYREPQMDPAQHEALYGYKPDIDLILEGLARESVILKMLERDPAKWLVLRAELSPQKLGVLNGFRQKFGLAPA